MNEFNETAHTADEALNICDKILEEDGGDRYTRGVKDALGWLLGHYEPPYCFEADDEGDVIGPSKGHSSCDT